MQSSLVKLDHDLAFWYLNSMVEYVTGCGSPSGLDRLDTCQLKIQPMLVLWSPGRSKVTRCLIVVEVLEEWTLDKWKNTREVNSNQV